MEKKIKLVYLSLSAALAVSSLAYSPFQAKASDGAKFRVVEQLCYHNNQHVGYGSACETGSNVQCVPNPCKHPTTAHSPE
jgi:hypothetical protein